MNQQADVLVLPTVLPCIGVHHELETRHSAMNATGMWAQLISDAPDIWYIEIYAKL